MRISSNYFSTNFLISTNKLQQQQNVLQNQATTQLKISNPEDNPAVMSQVLNLQAASDQNTQYQTNISQLQNAATTSYSALNALQPLISKANTIAASAINGTNNSPDQMASYAKQIQGLIQEAAQIANTQDAQGNYIFGGTASGGKPFDVTTDADGNISAVAYQGNASVAKSEIAPGVTVSAQSPGVNNSGSGAHGVFADSRSGADLFNHLLTLQQDITSGNTSAISSNDIPALAKDQTNATAQIAANGVLQSTLSSAANAASSQATNLASQISNATSADLATTITQLQQTQTAYQAALESGTQIFSMSILNYLQ